MRGHVGSVHSIAFSPAGRWVVSGASNVAFDSAERTGRILLILPMGMIGINYRSVTPVTRESLSLAYPVRLIRLLHLFRFGLSQFTVACSPQSGDAHRKSRGGVPGTPYLTLDAGLWPG